MKEILKLTAFSAVLLVLVVGLLSCDSNEVHYSCDSLFIPCERPEDLKPIPLEGTIWRLMYVDFQDGKDPLVLEPKDCDACFTLVFDTDTSALGLSIVNQVRVIRPQLMHYWCIYGPERYQYETDRRPKNMHGGTVLVTMEDYPEPYDGSLFALLLSRTHSMVIDFGMQKLLWNSVEILDGTVEVPGSSLVANSVKTTVLVFKQIKP